MSEPSPTTRGAPRRRAGVWLGALVATFVVAFMRKDGDPGEAGIVDLSGSVMGTYWNVRVVASADQAASLRDVVQSALDDVDLRFSTYKQDSLLSRFNAHRSTEPFDADAQLVEVLALAMRIADASEGAYDPTIYPVIKLWGFAGGEHHEPTAEQLADAMRSVGHDKLEILDGRRLHKLDPLVAIDLSSIAKGFGVDQASRALAAAGCSAHMVEVGGEVVCRGSKPDGAAWRIGIERPHPDEGEDEAPVQEVVELRDRAVATSGSYRNWFESGGKRRHHIVDARTGRNAESRVVSVSVEADRCMLADGLATALMIVGTEGTPALLKQFAPERIGVLFLLDEPGGIREVPFDWPPAAGPK